MDERHEQSKVFQQDGDPSSGAAYKFGARPRAYTATESRRLPVTEERLVVNVARPAAHDSEQDSLKGVADGDKK